MKLGLTSFDLFCLVALAGAVFAVTLVLKEVERLEVGWVDAAELLAIKTKLTEAFWAAQHAQHVTRYLTADTAGILD